MSKAEEYRNFRGNAKRLEDRDIPWIGSAIGVGEDELHAFMDVESRGHGFDPSNRPIILFEPHRFWHNLPSDKRKEAAAQGIAAPRWGMIPYGKENEQYDRLIKALEIDETAALKSASWGLCQVLGENYRTAGYDSIKEFIEAMMDDEENHLKACVNFLKANGIDDDLRAHRWDAVARAYNGAGYKKNNYDTKMRERFEWWRKKPDTPFNRSDAQNISKGPASVQSKDNFTNNEVEQIQKRLRELNYFEVGKIDGLWGTRTIGAIAAFQANEGLPVTVNTTPNLDAETQQRLAVASPREVAPERRNTTVRDLRNQGSSTIKQADSINWAQWGQFAMAILESIVLAWQHYPETNLPFGATLLTMFGTPAWVIPLIQFGIALYTRIKSNSVIMTRINSERSGLHNGEPDPAPSPPTVYPPERNEGLGPTGFSLNSLDLLRGPR
ncbi:N-acetylmuramidase domain-containing protein [Methylobacterium sp. yr668]|uniref:N-acetylmuramidase domain-containing protein n=1 Tax=Methylobacterium sp. yr668 TaxID=1761801 RepID=UPI0008EE91E2|nr:N-acetylmuramidase domain-containing protein [Methylobacterium sp. yr668]SFT26639.1 Putative peptidoglycan binding domain-containing protein [Methylobacterium sp. yr668]